MNLILFDQAGVRQQLLPLTFTRPVAALRVGILTIAEKWQRYFPEAHISYLTEPYLRKKFPLQKSSINLLINGAVCPNPEIMEAIQELGEDESLIKDKTLIACRCSREALDGFETEVPGPGKKNIPFEGCFFTLIDQVWHIFRQNSAELKSDFELITRNRKSAGISDEHTRTYNEENIFVEEGAKIRAAILNAENGPIYIGKGAQVHEGAIIKGPFALCEGSNVNTGAKMRGDTTIGPFSKVGGEVSNSVIQGYSNKGHEGFLGNSVLGEWCNIGADTNNSNLKNNYADIKIWNYQKGGFTNTGLQFCGLIMGDHSKCGINTMFNTGTVVGVSANIFGTGFPRQFVPSFSWGGSGGFSTFKLDKVFEVAEKVMERRHITLDETEKDILLHIFEQTAQYRVWEKTQQQSGSMVE
jgi:UDP-N-acetylglucosamine diphosphorylase/glucosamine-1-phosphate N-acetyltransferase